MMPTRRRDEPRSPNSEAQDLEIRRLFRERPRSRVIRFSLIALGALVVISWVGGEMWPGDFLSERRMENLSRFLGELVPYPLQGKEFDLSIAASFYGEVLEEKGWQAAMMTLAMSVVAIVLAAVGGFLIGPLAARSLTTAAPYLPAAQAPGRYRRFAWRSLLALTRVFLILARSIPEYVLAFIFLAVWGPNAWPLILALAVHNLGILGKLNAEIIENLEARPLEALRGLGATRLQLVTTGIFPLSLSRFLLYFFYRWETCVREATVLGMLGIVSLGFWILDTRARNHYDEMFFFILLGAGLVLVGDIASTLARGYVRRAG